METGPPPAYPLLWHRRQAGLSLRALAERAGVGWMTLYAIEHGRRPLNRTARKIAGALGVRVDDIADFADEARQD